MSQEPVLVQPVESPVICVPYLEPTHFWDYSRQTGQATKVVGRRPSYYWFKSSERVRQSTQEKFRASPTKPRRRGASLIWSTNYVGT